MEECQKKGLIRNLGLSNFNEGQIDKIMKGATIKPQVLQVELHANFQQRNLRKFCQDHDIVVTAYAPLGSPGAKNHFVSKYNYRCVCWANRWGWVSITPRKLLSGSIRNRERYLDLTFVLYFQSRCFS